MKKRKFLLGFIVLSLVLILVSCTEEKPTVHAHKYTEEVMVVEPTCTSKGVKKVICSCGYEKTEKVSALGHDLVEVEKVSATCTESGNESYKYCKNCDYNTYREIDAKGHNIVQVGKLEATCTVDGHEAYEYCKYCEYTTFEEIKSTGHDVVQVEKLEATCTEDGHNAYEYCKDCNYSTYEKVTSPGHSMNGSHCENCTFVFGVDLSHRDNAFTLEGGKLSLDSSQQTSPTVTLVIEIMADGVISFDYMISCQSSSSSFTVSVNSISVLVISGSQTDCFEIEVTIGDVVELTYSNGNSSTNLEDLVELSDFTYELIEVPATCLTDGSKLVFDIATGLYTIEVVEALNHDIVNYEGKEATCTTSGFLPYEACSRCEYSTYEPDSIPSGHTIQNVESKAPTCLDAGWEAYEYCSKCDYTTYKSIPATGHTFGEWDEQIKATCTTEGYKERHCANCTEIESENLEALGHKYETTETKATCLTGGFKHHQCIRCEYNYDSDHESALGHDLAYHWAQSATCELPGHNEYEECLREGCGYTTYVQTSPALGHDINYVAADLPTCTSGGHDAYEYCSRCDYSTYEYLSLLGHDFGAWETESEATCTLSAVIIQYCSRCEAFNEEFDKTRPALGHKLGEEGIVEPTMSTQGYKYQECSACDFVYKYDYTETLLTGLFIFEEYGNGYRIIGNNLTSEHTVLELPTEYNGKPVIGIKGHYSSGDTPFYGCEFVKVLIIPESITDIGQNALSGMWQLEELTISANAADYLAFMFDNRKYTNYDNSTFPSTLTKVTLTGNGGVNYRYFYNSSGNNLNTVILEEGITSIGSSAFVTCYEVTNISIPNSLTSIADDGISSCEKLNYTIYENGKYLGNENNPYLWLRDVTDTTLTTYTIHPEAKNISTRAFYDCTNLTDITIPENITHIGNYVFQGCSSLKEIVIPDTVTTFGSNVFHNCIQLTNVRLGTGIKTISGTFQGCSSLKEVVIPENVEYIGGDAFYNCDLLETIYIPASATQFGDAYVYCYGLVNVYYGGSFEDWQNIDYSNASNYWGSGYSEANPMASAENLYITNENGEYELVTEIHVPEGVEELKEYAYYGLSCVTAVHLPSTIKYIDDRAFAYCDSIVEVYTPLLEQLDIISTFAYVQKVVFTNEFEVLPEDYFYGAQQLKTVILPSTLKIISRQAFWGCTSLEAVDIPSGVTTIEEFAFAACTSLKDFVIPSGVTVLENNVFTNTGIKELIIPSTIEEIKEEAFASCYNLTKIVIPAELTNIEWGAFRFCKNVKEISMPVIGDYFGYLWSNGDYASYAPSKVDRVTIYGQEIPTNYFSIYNLEINELIISNSITKFGFYMAPGKLGSVYYLGTEEEWNNIEIDENPYLLRAPIYYYTDSCIHEANTKYWTYDDEGNPSTNVTVKEWNVALEPTCVADGSKEGHCIYCNEIIVDAIPMLKHTFVDNKCSSCGMDTYTVTHGQYSFFADSSGLFQSANYHINKSTASYIITANVTITLQIQYKVSSEAKYDFFYVIAAGKQIYGASGKDNYFTSKTVTLKPGETLEFKYVKDQGTHAGDDTAYFKINSVTVVE